MKSKNKIEYKMNLMQLHNSNKKQPINLFNSIKVVGIIQQFKNSKAQKHRLFKVLVLSSVRTLFVYSIELFYNNKATISLPSYILKLKNIIDVFATPLK